MDDHDDVYYGFFVSKYRHMNDFMKQKKIQIHS